MRLQFDEFLAAMSQAATVRGWKPYRYQGRPDWDPAAGFGVPPKPGHGPSALQRERAERRRAEFGRLRAAGVPVSEAGARVGIRPDTARRYEARRRKAAALQVSEEAA